MLTWTDADHHLKTLYIPEPIAVESCNRDGEGFDRVVVRHSVKVIGRRYPYIDMTAFPDFQDAFNCLCEKADSIQRNASIFICSPV